MKATFDLTDRDKPLLIISAESGLESITLAQFVRDDSHQFRVFMMRRIDIGRLSSVVLEAVDPT